MVKIEKSNLLLAQTRHIEDMSRKGGAEIVYNDTEIEPDIERFKFPFISVQIYVHAHVLPRGKLIVMGEARATPF